MWDRTCLRAPPTIILCSCREETGIPLPCTQVLGLVLSQFESSSKKCSSQDLSSVQAHKAGQSVRGLVLHVGLLGCSTAPAGLSQGYPTAMCCLTAYCTTMVILQSSMYYNTGQDFGFARHDALGLSQGYPTPLQLSNTMPSLSNSQIDSSVKD